MTFPKEFKEALSHLPSKEKDKLILRLLKKDVVLANRLLFELVSSNTVEEQRDQLETSLLYRIKKEAERGHYSIGYLNWDVREYSGLITQHVKITKDKFGEAYLNLIMINEILSINRNFILESRPPAKRRKFCVAVIARAFKILLLIHKLDDDFLMELEPHLKEFAELIAENQFLMDTAIKNGLDINWLHRAEIPEDIISVHKEIRANGFLK
jgi:hypothetical protein